MFPENITGILCFIYRFSNSIFRFSLFCLQVFSLIIKVFPVIFPGFPTLYYLIMRTERMKRTHLWCQMLLVSLTCCLLVLWIKSSVQHNHNITYIYIFSISFIYCIISTSLVYTMYILYSIYWSSQGDNTLKWQSYYPLSTMGGCWW